MVAWLVLLFLGALALWFAVPVAWLWVASQVQAATNNVGAAVVAGFVGFLFSIPVVMAGLGAVNVRYQRARVRRGLEDTGDFPLETTIVITAVVSAIGFAIWFFGFSGATPLPFLGSGD